MKGAAILACAVVASVACSPSSNADQRPASRLFTADDSIKSTPAPQLYTIQSPNSAADSISAMLAERYRLAVDSITIANPRNLFFVVRLPRVRFVLLGRIDDAPDSVDDMIAVVHDVKGHLVAIGEVPIVESDDWSIQYKHYFDTTGATLAVARTASLDKGCKSAKGDSTIGIREVVTSYFTPSHRLVKRTFARTTLSDSTPAPTSSCDESFRTAYRIYPSWDSLAASTGLGDFLRHPHT
jgi:hypothetical protein